jgi:hypothetical protein
MVFMLLAVIACGLTAGTPIFVASVLNAVVSFWANGTIETFRSDPANTPASAAVLSALTIIATGVLAVVAVLVR